MLWETDKEKQMNHDKRLDAALKHMRVSVDMILMCVDDQAQDLRKEANQLIIDTGRQGQKTGRLRLSVRQREGRWGPDIIWIRVPKKFAKGGHKLKKFHAKPENIRYSTPVSMHGKRSVRRRIFENLGGVLPKRLNEIEDECVRLRVTIEMLRKCMAGIKEFVPEATAQTTAMRPLEGLGRDGEET